MKTEITVGGVSASLTDLRIERLSAILFTDIPHVTSQQFVSKTTAYQMLYGESGMLKSFNADSLDQLRMRHLLFDPNYRFECLRYGSELSDSPKALQLTGRRFQLANLLFLGEKNENLGRMIGVTDKGVEFHQQKLRIELNISVNRVSQFELACVLLKYGLPIYNGMPIESTASLTVDQLRNSFSSILRVQRSSRVVLRS